MAREEGRQAWVALVVCVAAVLIASGARFSFTAFVVPMEADLGWDRATLSAAASLNALTYGLGQLAVGFLVDRWGPRRVMLASLGLMALGAYGLSQATELWQLFLFYGILPGFGFAGAALVPASALLLGWFPRRPALAVGVASAGLPGGQAVFVPIVAALIPLLGWRPTYLGLGLAMALVAAPLVWLLARDPPRYAPEAALPRPQGAHLGGWGLVVLLSAVFFACGLTDQLVTVHLLPFASGLGVSPVLAATAQSIMTAAGIAGSVVAGRISDGWSPRGVLALIYLLRAALFPLLLIFGATTDAVLLYAFALLFGPTYIANVAPGGRLLRERYGQANVGSVLGVTQFVHQIGGAIGIGLGGLSFTLAGTYGPAFIVASAAAFAGGLACLALPRAQRPTAVPPRVG